MKKFITIFIKHPLAANMLMTLMILSGVWALFKMNTQFLPNFDLNFVTINVSWPGANAEDVEKSIIRPIEDEVHDVDYIKKMTSRARLGGGTIVLEFNAGTDMNAALSDVEQRVGMIRDLPTDSEPPIINRVIRYEQVARLIVTGGDSLDELRPWVYKFERELLNSGIAKVQINGLPALEIAIAIPSQQLEALNLSLLAIADKIASQSQDLPAGNVGRSDLGKELRSESKRRTVRGFANLPVVHDDKGRLIRLGDIATITLRSRDNQAHMFYQGNPAIELSLLRTEFANSLASAKIFHQWLNDIKASLPQAIKVVPYYEGWKRIKERVMLLVKNGAWGLILILILLYLFLNFRIATWVAIGIPASFFAAISAVYCFGGSINMVSMFAMIMTLGIIVDDSIVVGEEMLSQSQQGKPLLESIQNAVHLMKVPVLASSLTTIATFLPLMLIGGVMGQILFAIPLVAICVILAALIECFLVLPGHLYHSAKKITIKEGPLNKYLTEFREQRFRPFVEWVVSHAWITISVAVFLVFITMGMLMSGWVKFNLFPTPEGSKIEVNAQFTAGTPKTEAQQFLKMLTKTLSQTDEQLSRKGKSLLVAYTAVQNRSTVSREGTSSEGEQHVSMSVELVSPESRQISNQQFIKTWHSKVPIPAGLESFSISVPRAGPPGRDIEIEISGSQLSQLKQAANYLKLRLGTIKGVNNIIDDLPYGKPHIVFDLNSQGYSLGLTTASVGAQLRAAFNGKIAQIYHNENEEVEVRVILPDSERFRSDILQRLPIITPGGKAVPLSSVVHLKTLKGFDEIRHIDRRLSVKVTADVNTNVNNANQVLKALGKTVLPTMVKTYNVNYHLAGRAEEQAETFHDMIMGLIVALALVYIILAWVFASYTWPIFVMIAIPLGLVGAIWGHIIMGITLTILSLFGFFGLAGIVVNDSIILINRYKKLKELDNMPCRQAIIEASCQRLRPVLLTSATTIAGLLPLLFERSLQAQFLIPMAVSIVFGLIASTFLILLLIPAFLYLFESRSYEKGIKG